MEIRTAPALAVPRKPGGRARFILAKFVGLALGLTVLTYVNMIGAFFASRMAFDSYGSVDLVSLSVFAGSLVAAYAMAGFSNFFLRRVVTADAVFAVVRLVTLAHGVACNIGRDVPGRVAKEASGWRGRPG